MIAKRLHIKNRFLRKKFSGLVIFICAALISSGQSGNNKLSDVITQLKAFSDSHIFEQVYLQFDKPYYAGGDTMYFKAYLTVGNLHQLSALSGILHIDLIDPESRIEQSILLQSNGGLCWGDFALPDSLPAGSYRVRAYTEWMRNNDEMDFFDKVIPVGSIKNEISDETLKPPQPITNHIPDIQFFPEGGNLVAGIETKVAFKALDTNGLGTDVKGIIFDAQNKIIDSFSSTHSGMGCFSFLPAKHAVYRAKVTFAGGMQQTVDLPIPDSAGICLSVNNRDTAKAVIEIRANPAYYLANQNKNYFLIFYSGGKALTAPFILDTRITTLTIRKEQLHSGIATVTLFSGTGQPLCERLLFIQKHDGLVLHITSDKMTYNKREKVNLLINTGNESGEKGTGHLSISVINESVVPEAESDETTIQTHLLLTSGVTGYVEHPNYYFINTDSQVRNDLDVLMLTQGYRRFQWQQVLHNDDSLPVAFPAEKGLEIDGIATNVAGKPLGKATITLVPSAGGPLLSSVSDSKGAFQFENLIFSDTTPFVLSAVNSKGKNLTKISYIAKHSVPAINVLGKEHALQTVNDTIMSVYLIHEKQYIQDAMLMDKSKAHLLKEVTVQTKRQINSYRTQSFAGAGHADQVMHANEIEQVGGRLSTSLYGRLRGVGFTNGKPYLQNLSALSGIGGGYMLVVVDGTEIEIDSASSFDIDQIPSTQVETVEVLKYTSSSIFGMSGANGVLVITTKQDEDRAKDITAVGILPITPTGFYKARVFYSPKYYYANASAKQADLRSTIYWNPDIQTDKDGNASVEYYNADGIGTYKVVIEGIDINGNIGRQVYRYAVQQ